MLLAMATEVTPLVSRLNVVYLYVTDMERSLRFYRDLLGLPLEGDGHWAEATLDGVRFALHALDGEPVELSSGTVRIDFEVSDVDTAAGRARAAGAEVRETMRDAWGSAVEVVDPDGYRIHLFQPPA
jgi:predicted enzyme related to lactoylglutathione lyase